MPEETSRPDELAGLFEQKPEEFAEPPKDELAALFDQALGSVDEADESKQQRLQCEISEKDRLANIKNRLNDFDDKSTSLGFKIVELLGADEIHGPQLIEIVRADGEGGLADRLIKQSSEAPLSRQGVLAELQAQVNYLTDGVYGQGNIFPELPFDKKTPEEGARRQKGESTLVVARAALLTAGLEEIAKGDFAAASLRLKESRTDFLFGCPDWVVNGIDQSLRKYDISQMGESDLDKLHAIRYRFDHQFPTTSGEEQRIRDTDISELSGWDLTSKMALEAEARIKAVNAEIKMREEAVKHDTEYEEYKIQSFGEQARGVKEKAITNLKASDPSYQRIFLEVGSDHLMQNMLRLDASIWKKYSDNQTSMGGTLQTLRALSEGPVLDKIAAAMIDQRSGMYAHNDGTYSSLGSYDLLPPEKALHSARIQAERRVFASAFGALQAHFEYKSPSGNESFVNPQRLATMVDVMKIVGNGHAQELMKSINLEQFNENQILFRQELISYLSTLPADTPERRLFSAALVEGSVKADTTIKQEQEQRRKIEEETSTKFDLLKTRVVNARNALEHIPELKAYAAEASRILSINDRELPDYLVVTGENEARKLEINAEKRDQLQRSVSELETKLREEQDPATREKLLEEKALNTVQLSVYDEFVAALPALEKTRFSWKSGLGPFTKQHASYDRRKLAEYTSSETIPLEIHQLERTEEVIWGHGKDTYWTQVESLEARLKALSAGGINLIEKTREMDDVIRAADVVQTNIDSLLNRAQRVGGSAAKDAVKNALSNLGPLNRLSQRKGQFEDIIRSNS